MNSERLEAAIRMMISTDRMHKQVFDKRLADIGIHRSSHIILLNIHRNGGLSSQKELAGILGISPAAVTGALKRLESNGYVERKYGQDSRYNEVTLTESGRELLASAKNMFTEVDKALFENFSEEELNNYISCLEKMQENMKKLKSEGDECL